MVLKNSLMTASAVVVLGVAAVAGVSARSGEDFSNTLSERIAQEYNLDQAEVQSLIDTTREELYEEKQAEREAAMTQKLEEAVADGTITEEQKDRILDFRAEQQTAREALKDIEDEEERRAAHEELRGAFETFREENSDIPWEDLKPEDDGRRGRPRHHHSSFDNGEDESMLEPETS